MRIWRLVRNHLLSKENWCYGRRHHKYAQVARRIWQKIRRDPYQTNHLLQWKVWFWPNWEVLKCGQIQRDNEMDKGNERKVLWRQEGRAIIQ